MLQVGLGPDEVVEFFSIHLIISAALSPGVYSVHNRVCIRKNKESFWGVECGQCVD
jgi:hypothetical protein